MNIPTNTQNRKVLAQELSRLIGEPYTYLGVPSCAYQVGPFRINKDGSIDGDDFGAIHSFLVENDYIHETIGVEPEEEHLAPADSEADPLSADDEAQDTTPSDEAAPTDFEFTETYVSIPIRDYTPLALTCLLKTLYARQKLIAAMTQSDLIALDEKLIDRLQDEKPDTIEKIQELLHQEIEAGFVKGITIEDGKITMAFPYDPSQPTQWQAYAEILMRLEKHSKVAHHASAKRMEPTPEEMKYFCRNWLVQLGLGGPEHKETRQILLGHLTGFAAFRSSDQMNAHKQRYAARRREAREAAKAKAIQEQAEEVEHHD